MKKIYKLKKWLTLEETAERLSIELNEKVTKADVLQLALDEELKISIHIPIDLTAKKCEFVKREECTYFNIGADFILQMEEFVNEIKEKLNLDNMPDDILKERLDIRNADLDSMTEEEQQAEWDKLLAFIYLGSFLKLFVRKVATAPILEKWEVVEGMESKED